MTALIAIFPLFFSLALEVSKTCQHVGHQLLADQTVGRITEAQAAETFRLCQLRYAPLDASQPTTQ